MGALSKYEIFDNFSFLGVGKLILAGLPYLKNFSTTPVNGQLISPVSCQPVINILREYLLEFSKTFKMATMEYLGARGTMIHEKT